jgi:hypothetical protein
VQVVIIEVVVMWGGRSFGLHTSKVRAKDRGHTYSLHRTHMGLYWSWTVNFHACTGCQRCLRVIEIVPNSNNVWLKKTWHTSVQATAFTPPKG